MTKIIHAVYISISDQQSVQSFIECSVCLQPCIHPVQLECRHIFCFLCVKGAANRSKRCALCRSEIDPDFFSNPKLVRYEDLENTVRFDNQFQWFYQGGNGWWQYDDRTSQEIEAKHKVGEKVFELLIAGFLYIIDLENMVQVRRNDRSRKRKIRRDVISLQGVKGVAGLKYPKSPNSSSDRPVGDGNEDISQSNQQRVPPQQHPTPPVSNTPLGAVADTATPVVPNNTPQAPNTPVDSPTSSVSSSQQDLSVDLQNLNLGDNLHSDFSQAGHSDDGEQDLHVDVAEGRSRLQGAELMDQLRRGQHDVSGYESSTYPMTRSRVRYLEHAGVGQHYSMGGSQSVVRASGRQEAEYSSSEEEEEEDSLTTADSLIS